MTTQHIVKDKAELSANQLAEYLSASYSRKESILRAAKFQSRETSAARIRYRDARASMARCLASNRLDIGILQPTRDYLQGIIEQSAAGQRNASDFTVSDAKLSLESITAFLGGMNSYTFSGMTFALGDSRPPRLPIEGVAVSVRPDVVVTAVGKQQQPKVGGLLLYLGKGTNREGREAKRKEICETAALLVRLFAEKHLASQGEIDRKLCLSLDVFDQVLHQSPAAYVRRLDNLEAACRGIASQWPAITPPENWPIT
jgi:hypothetical protein